MHVVGIDVRMSKEKFRLQVGSSMTIIWEKKQTIEHTG